MSMIILTLKGAGVKHDLRWLKPSLGIQAPAPVRNVQGGRPLLSPSPGLWPGFESICLSPGEGEATPPFSWKILPSLRHPAAEKDQISWRRGGRE